MDVETLAALIMRERSDAYSDDGRVWKKAKEELRAALALVDDVTKAAAYEQAKGQQR